MKDVAFGTEEFPESVNGLMICGINWGGVPATQVAGEECHHSFFSDCSPSVANDCRFRTRIINWFRLFGHPLATEPGMEGAFERSISQVNWLPTQTRDTNGMCIRDECARGSDYFFRNLEHVRPRVLIFVSTELLRAVNNPRCLKRAERILGASRPCRFVTKDVRSEGRSLTAFRVGFQEFAECQVIALPHPAAGRGVSDEYVRAFAGEIGTILSDFRRTLNTKNNASISPCVYGEARSTVSNMEDAR